MDYTTEKPEEMIAERLKAGFSFEQIANLLGVPAEQVESVCFSLCHTNPKEFKYRTYLTKEWLEAKAKDHSVRAIAAITQLNYITSGNTAFPHGNRPETFSRQRKSCSGFM